MDDDRGVVLVADIGGTHARFALVSRQGLGQVVTLQVADFPSPEDAALAFLSQVRTDDPPARAVLAVAGPVEDGRVRMTNAGWTVDAAVIRDSLGLFDAVVLNDFEATAWGLPAFGYNDVQRFGGGAAEPGAPIAVIGPGTGFGCAALIAPGSAFESVLVTEGGHAALPAEDERDAAILAALRPLIGRTSIERAALSGQGLVHLRQAVAIVDGSEDHAPMQSERITAEALAGPGLSRTALDLFCGFLGSVAGDIALMMGARGGVTMAGGILPRFPDFLAASRFRSRFESKGRMSPLVAEIPTTLIMDPHATFRGLVRYVERHPV